MADKTQPSPPVIMGPDLHKVQWDAIRRRNWRRVHLAADRRDPVNIPDRSSHVVLQPPSRGCKLWTRDNG